MVVVEPASPRDLGAIRTIFRDTIGFGRPLEVPLPEAYERLCLGFYTDHPAGHAAVARHDGRVVGYALVCTEQTAFDRWLRRQVPRYTVATLPATLRPRRDGPGPFLRLRLMDGLASLRGPRAVADAHVHMNLEAGARGALLGRRLVAHADRVVAAAGRDAWFAEVNARRGHRAMAFERYGAEIVHRAPNRTFSALAGEPVVRLTIRRELRTARPVLSS